MHSHSGTRELCGGLELYFEKIEFQKSSNFSLIVEW